MSSENAVSNLKTDLEDSGCVQDADSIQHSTFQTNLLDMPDDVLLYILQSLKARDLKALGYCSRRLCRLVQEKALWRYVDARDDKCSRARLTWFLDNVLRTDTQVLLLSGYAKDADGCLGFMCLSREEGERVLNSDPNWEYEQFALQLSAVRDPAQGPKKVCSPNEYWYRRCGGLMSWDDNGVGKKGPYSCIGPQFSLSQNLLQRLCETCPKLHTLALEYCNIDCRTTSLDQFPNSLKKLSLRGSICYNMVLDKTFLFRVNRYLPDLESLDVSECEWMDPATLLPLSKLASLHELFAQKCAKMTEFVAYASLTARYGFKSLKSLDLRGSPVGDSEVSALGWLPTLEKLWLSASKNTVAKSDDAHAHFIDDPDINHVQLHEWEIKEKSFYSETPENIFYYYDDEDMEIKGKDSSKRKSESEQENDGESTNVRRESTNKRQKLDQDAAINEINDKETNNNETDDTHNEDNDMFERPSTSKSEVNKDGKSEENSMDNMNKETGESSSSSKKNEDAPSEKNNQNGGHALDNLKERSAVDRIKIDRRLKCGEILRYDDQGEVLLFTSIKRRVQSPAPSVHIRIRCTERPRVVNESGSESVNDNSDNKLNLKRPHEVNEGASTSRQEPDTSEPKPKPEINQNQNRNQQNQENVRDNEPIDYRIEPRHHVLYVNVGPQVNAIYRFPRDVSPPGFPGIRSFNMPRRHIEASSLVTDFAIRRFGRADGEDVNIIHIGPNGPVVFGQDMASRPDRSNLRFLSVNGYRNVTDRSLVHLATAAPNLMEIDFSDTNVTESGAESFRALRPDCKLVYTKFTERED